MNLKHSLYSGKIVFVVKQWIDCNVTVCEKNVDKSVNKKNKNKNTPRIIKIPLICLSHQTTYVDTTTPLNKPFGRFFMYYQTSSNKSSIVKC